MAENDFTQYSIDPELTGGIGTVFPGVEQQSSQTNLNAGGSVSFDFDADSLMIFDAFVFSDVALDMTISVKAATAHTFRQLGASFPACNAGSPAGNPLIGRRIPGSIVRITVTNNGVAASTTCEIQIHARSL